MKRSFQTLVALGVLAASLVGCGSSATMFPSSGSSIDVAGIYPSASPSAIPADLAQLIAQESLSPEEIKIRQNLSREVKLDFPIKVGVLMFGHQSELKENDQQKLLDQIKADFKASGLIRETILIPSNLLGAYGSSMEMVRQVGSRFKVDLMLVVSGKHRYIRSSSQPLNFFESFGDRAYFESTVKMDGVILDVYTGAYLTPLSVAANSESKAFSPSSTTYAQESYAFKQQNELQVWERMSKDFLEAVSMAKEESDKLPPRPSALPVPSSTPTPVPTAMPTHVSNPA